MRFSEYFNITRRDEDWFDPILDQDTELFLDPTLIYASGQPPFASAKEKLSTFFEEVYELADLCRHTTDKRLKKERDRNLRTMLTFPEVPQLCLGYTVCSTAGSGVGRGFSGTLARAAQDAPCQARERPEHFELLALYSPGIARDRISDIGANLLKPELISYTQEVCRRHKVPMEAFTLPHCEWDPKTSDWREADHELPRNPYNDQALLLVPESFLNQEPTLSPNDFWNYVWSKDQEALRNGLGLERKTRRLADIRDFVKGHPKVVEAYLGSLRVSKARGPYPLEMDPQGLYRWDERTQSYAEKHPVKKKDLQTLADFLQVSVQRFQHFVEEAEGDELLWNSKPRLPKRERAAQLVFAGLIKRYARNHKILIEGCLETGVSAIRFQRQRPEEEGEPQGREELPRLEELRVWLQVRLVGNRRFRKSVAKLGAKFFRKEKVDLAQVVLVIHQRKYFEDRRVSRDLSDLHNSLRSLGHRAGIPLEVMQVDATRLDPRKEEPASA